jgi:hypothetical protein
MKILLEPEKQEKRILEEFLDPGEPIWARATLAGRRSN